MLWPRLLMMPVSMQGERDSHYHPPLGSGRIVKALDTPTEGVPNGKLPSSSLELAGLEVDVRNVSFAYEQAAGSNGVVGWHVREN